MSFLCADAGVRPSNSHAAPGSHARIFRSHALTRRSSDGSEHRVSCVTQDTRVCTLAKGLFRVRVLRTWRRERRLCRALLPGGSDHSVLGPPFEEDSELPMHRYMEDFGYDEAPPLPPPPRHACWLLPRPAPPPPGSTWDVPPAPREPAPPGPEHWMDRRARLQAAVSAERADERRAFRRALERLGRAQAERRARGAGELAVSRGMVLGLAARELSAGVWRLEFAGGGGSGDGEGGAREEARGDSSAQEQGHDDPSAGNQGYDDPSPVDEGSFSPDGWTAQAAPEEGGARRAWTPALVPREAHGLVPGIEVVLCPESGFLEAFLPDAGRDASEDEAEEDAQVWRGLPKIQEWSETMLSSDSSFPSNAFLPRGVVLSTTEQYLDVSVCPASARALRAACSSPPSRVSALAASRSEQTWERQARALDCLGLSAAQHRAEEPLLCILLGLGPGARLAARPPPWTRRPSWRANVEGVGARRLGHLDAVQRSAAVRAAHRTLSLWQGPPGAGKTRALAALVALVADLDALARREDGEEDGEGDRADEWVDGSLAAWQFDGSMQRRLESKRRLNHREHPGYDLSPRFGLASDSLLVPDSPLRRRHTPRNEDPDGLQPRAGCVLAVAESNAAADALLEALAALGLRVARAGRPERVAAHLRHLCLGALEARAPEAARARGAAPAEARRLAQAARRRILGHAQAVVATCSAAGGLAGARFRCVVVDEATQASEPAVLVALLRGAQSALLVGDPAQLPPTIRSERAKALGLGVSLFERLAGRGAEAWGGGGQAVLGNDAASSSGSSQNITVEDIRAALGEPLPITSPPTSPLPLSRACSHYARASSIAVDSVSLLFEEGDREPYSSFASHAPPEPEPMRPELLGTQYRMHPALASFSARAFYGGQLRSGVEAADRPPVLGIDWLPSASSEKEGSYSPGPPHPVLFLESLGSERLVRLAASATAPAVADGELALPGQERPSYVNAREADQAVAVLAAASRRDPSLRSVALLTPYRAQRALLRRSARGALRMPSSSASSGGWARVPPELWVATVDGFQGQEADLVVLSLVRSARLGFLTDRRRLNVALTRARRGVVVIGHRELLEKDEFWKSWLDQLDRDTGRRGGVRKGGEPE